MEPCGRSHGGTGPFREVDAGCRPGTPVQPGEVLPTGPLLVTPDEFQDPDSIELGCLVNGEQVQKGNTSDMVFTVPAIVSRLSSVTPLLPGDVIFTGTPPGVGVGRSPQRFLAPGDELVTYMQGVGEMRHRMRG